jgi:hypothetical protein
MTIKEIPKRHALYNILEEMVVCAATGDAQKLRELNRAYNKLEPKETSNAPQWVLDYDYCRQSCQMAVTQPDRRDECFADAKERFDRIPKP